MAIPHLSKVRAALWEELEKVGGTGQVQDIIEKLAQRFELTIDERELRDPTGQRTFDHRVHSAVAQSRIVGWIASVEVAGRGVWKLTSYYFEDNPPISREKERKDELTKRLKAVEYALDKLKESIFGLIPEVD